MKKKIFYLVWLSFFVACTHIVPAPARKMPIIRVLNQKKIEDIPLEKYVASVLFGEIHPSWPLEALKAQAIAARTFALVKMKQRKNKKYHLKNSIYDQVFKKKPGEQLIRAARESAGLVLTINNELAETSFHSTCGGKTASSKTVWGKSFSHLMGTNCNYCKRSPTYKWQTEIPILSLQRLFSQKIKKISILSRSNDGRADLLLLSGSKQQTISANYFRKKIGPMKLKSTLLESITIEGLKVLISGRGFGHGVGMCQYGAMGMAKSGFRFQQILAHYYPGTKLKKLY